MSVMCNLTSNKHVRDTKKVNTWFTKGVSTQVQWPYVAYVATNGDPPQMMNKDSFVAHPSSYGKPF